MERIDVFELPPDLDFHAKPRPVDHPRDEPVPRCPEYQADGVPCADAHGSCEVCPRADPAA